MSARRILAAARAAGRAALLEPEAKALLREYGIAVPRSVVVGCDAELDTAGTLRAPYVLKLVSAGVLHKSDVGGVRVGLADLTAVRAAMVEMREQLVSRGHSIAAYLVEEMVPRGHEIVVGGTIHPQFGPVLMVGLGGVFVEILNDVAFRLCPIDLEDAHEMLAELRGRPILGGARGGLVVDPEVIAAVLMKIGGAGGLLAKLGDEIGELDLNPLIVGATEATAVDARIILARRAQ